MERCLVPKILYTPKISLPTVCLKVVQQQTVNSNNNYIKGDYICTVRVLGALLLLTLLNSIYFTHTANQKYLGKHCAYNNCKKIFNCH